MKKLHLTFLHVVIISFVLICLAYLGFVNIKQELVGKYFWDTMVFDGIAYAIQNGYVPSKDFSATMIIPFYIRYWAQIIAFGGFAENIELIIYLVFLAVFFFGLMYEKLSPARLLAIFLLIAIFMLSRVNTTYVVSGLVHAGSYNRFLDLLIFILILSAIPTIDTKKSVKYIRLLLYSFILVVSFYMKMSAFFMASALIILILISSRNYKTTDIFAPWFIYILTLLIINQSMGIGTEYVSFLHQMGEFKSLHFHEQLQEWRLGSFFKRHWIDIILLLLMVFFYIGYFLTYFKNINIADELTKKHKSKFLRISVPLYVTILSVFSIAGVIMFNLTNYGDFGLLTLAALFIFIYHTFKFHDIVIAEEKKKLFKYVGIVFVAIYFVKLIQTDIKYLHIRLHDDLLSVNNAIEKCNIIVEPKIDYFDTLLIREKTLNEFRTSSYLEIFDDQNIQNQGWYENKYFFAYLYLLNDMHQTIEGLNLSKQDSIYLLDFPSYILASFSNMRIPKHTYPFLLFNHELDESYYPDPKVLFADVDYLVTTSYSLTHLNRNNLNSLYRTAIRDYFIPIQSKKGYMIWRKKID